MIKLCVELIEKTCQCTFYISLSFSRFTELLHLCLREDFHNKSSIKELMRLFSSALAAESKLVLFCVFRVNYLNFMKSFCVDQFKV